MYLYEINIYIKIYITEESALLLKVINVLLHTTVHIIIS